MSGPRTPRPVPRQPADEAAFLQMREWIASGVLLQGERLVPEHLAERLGVSRTPVVSALKRLAQVGLVDWVPNSGACVKRWSRLELAKVFELRGVLEGLAARHAATKMTPAGIDALEALFEGFRGLSGEQGAAPRVVRDYLAQDRRFHRAIIEAADSEMLLSTIEQIHVTTTSFAAGLIRTISSGLLEHAEIVAAMRARDGEACERAMRRHLQRSVDWLYEEAELEAEGRKGATG